jgi:hypothetical protein
MLAILLLLLLILVIAGLGFAIKALFWVALILFAVWLAGFFTRSEGRRWYYW